MTFQKGQSGNPNGRPKSEQAITPWLRKLLASKREGKTRAQHVAESLLSLAEHGDIGAQRLVLERIDGKVLEQIALEGELVKFIGVDRERACP